MSLEAGKDNAFRRIAPAKLSHAVLRTTRLNEMVRWYKTVLNAEVLYQNEFLVFMTYDEEHHRLAFVQVPGLAEKPKACAGLDHLAFFYSTFGDWIETYERLKNVGIVPRVPIHHGLSMSLYYRDPDGNGVELSIDNVERSEWHDWMRHQLGKNPLGVSFDPDELARKYHAGVPEADLRRYEPGSGNSPDVIRRLLE
jgi:catechol-2,3-dioxygenase